jgi:hypothetical protein
MGGVTIKDTWAMPRDEYTAHTKDIPFMSEQWLDMFAHIVAECERLGLICRSRLGSGWNEGGPWIEPEMSSKVLAFAKSEPMKGPQKYVGPIPKDKNGLPTAEHLKTGNAFVLALHNEDQETVDLTNQVRSDGRLQWNIPEGTWSLLSCFGKPSGKKLMSASDTGRGLHHDHLSTAGTDLHIRKLAGPMLATLGGFEDTAFDGFNNDSWELGNPTWTSSLRDIFIQMCGYDPVPYFPVMAGYKMGDKGQRFLYDFRTAVSDLIVENFFRHASKWCQAHGIVLEAQAAGGPSHWVPMDLLKACGASDIPMGEIWIHGRAYVKIPSSAAHAYGKPLVGLEYGTQKAWFFCPTPALLKIRADEAFLLGANYLCLPSVDYNPMEAGRPGWVHLQPGCLGLSQTWWSLSRPLFDYLARCCLLLQSGRHQASVAVYNSFLSQDRTLWLAPDDDNLSNHPKEYSFDYVNDDLIQNHMWVQDGRLFLSSGTSYQILYITPDSLSSAGISRRANSFTVPRSRMPIETLESIQDLIDRGATVVWAGDPPTKPPSLRGYPDMDAKYEAIVKELWANEALVKTPCHDYSNLLPILEDSPDPPAWRFANDVPLRVVHRQLPEANIFFIFNLWILEDYENLTRFLVARDLSTGSSTNFFSQNQTVETSMTFRINDCKPEFWFPETGEISPAPYKELPEGVSVNVKLPAHSSVFVVFRKTKGVPKYDQTAVEPTGSHALVYPIGGPWLIEFPEGWGAPANVTMPRLKSWTKMDDPNIRYFNGIATYSTTFTWDRKTQEALIATLDLGCVAELCEVWLNGRRLGVAWHPPYCFDVSSCLERGTNHLKVRVVNTWHNRLVGDSVLPKEKRVTRMYPSNGYRRFRGRKLIESGLMGPVRLIFNKRD